MKHILTDEHKATLRSWHSQLETHRGLRASLRRSKSVNDICMSEGFRSLLLQTHTLWKVNHQPWRFMALALVAGLLSQVKQNDESVTFAARAGSGEGGRTLMSELRFSRLLAVKKPDDLLRQLRRSIMLMGARVNIISLAEDIFLWCRESEDQRNHFRPQQPVTDFLRIRWALDYYQANEADAPTLVTNTDKE